MSMNVVFATIIITVMNCGADYLLKVASLKNVSPYATMEAFFGAVLYAASAYIWVYVMQRVNLTVVGVLYSTMTILALTLMSVLIFREDVSIRQYVGAGLALLAIVVTASE